MSELGGIDLGPIWLSSAMIGSSVIGWFLSIQCASLLIKEKRNPWKLIDSRITRVSTDGLHSLSKTLPKGTSPRFEKTINLCSHLLNVEHGSQSAHVERLTAAEAYRRIHPIVDDYHSEMNAWLPLLGSIAAVPPLLGLLGTVLGMIKSFGAMAQGEGASIGSASGGLELSEGVAQALLTTQAGLLVGLPLLILHRVLRSRLSKLTSASRSRFRRLCLHYEQWGQAQ